MNAMNIVEYDEIRSKMDEVKELCNFIPDVSTDEGYEKSKRVALDVRKLCTSLEAKRKEKKSYFLEGGKQVDAQAKKIAEELESYLLPHKRAYQELDNLRKEREVNRKAELERRVAEIRDLPEVMRDSSSDEIKMALESLQAEECLDFYEYSTPALKARNASREAMAQLFAKTLKSEEEKRELDRLRKESEARAIKDREDAIRKEAKEKAEEQERLAKEREAQAIQDKKDAEELLRQQKIQAAADQKRAVEKAKQEQIAKVEAENKRLADEKAKREKNEKHVARIKDEIVDDLVKLGATKKLAGLISVALYEGDIRNTQVNL